MIVQPYFCFCLLGIFNSRVNIPNRSTCEQSLFRVGVSLTVPHLDGVERSTVSSVTLFLSNNECQFVCDVHNLTVTVKENGRLGCPTVVLGSTSNT